MMFPYEPKLGSIRGVPASVIAEMEAKDAEYYRKKKVTWEIATEDKGSILKMYVDGKHIGGAQQLADHL